MKIEVIKDDKPKKEFYKLSVKVMYGDDDAYETFYVKFNKSINEREDLVHLVYKILKDLKFGKKCYDLSDANYLFSVDSIEWESEELYEDLFKYVVDYTEMYFESETCGEGGIYSVKFEDELGNKCIIK